MKPSIRYRARAIFYALCFSVRPSWLYEDNCHHEWSYLLHYYVKMNYNNIERTTLNGYVLFGISHFFQVIKDKKLRELSLGGIRRFNYTSSNPGDGTNGYWQHFHQTWSDATIPYVFQPVRNDIYF